MGASLNVAISVSATGTGAANTVTLSLPSGQAAVTNYPLQIGRAFLQGEIPNMPTFAGLMTQADVKNRYPDGSVAFAVLSTLVASIPTSSPTVLRILDSRAAGAGAVAGNIPLTQSQMLDPSYGFDAQLTAVNGANSGSASARTMLAAGKYTTWTAGPIAQTIILTDDTGFSYDISLDGGASHSLHPRFVATFWPTTKQVQVRLIAENCRTDAAQDLAYTATVTAGTTPVTVYTTDLTGTQATNKKFHWAFTTWTQRFWLNGAPPDQVNVDHNLAYLSSTRFLPNYDPAVAPTATVVANQYTNLWLGKAHNIYDGIWDAGLWESVMSSPGERQEIGPYPSWAVMWLYSGDWRMRLMSLGMADLAGGFPGHLREAVAGKRLLRTDPAGSSTGLGRIMSLTDRKTIVCNHFDYSYTLPGDAVKVLNPTGQSSQWTFDDAHQPAPFFVPYLLTGDPWYLDEMFLWASYTAGLTNGAATGYPYGRGPTGAEGGAAGELRAVGWLLRNRAEAAFIAPDGTPEKTYLTTLVNDALARWEGGLQITGTALDGTAEKNWGLSMGNNYSGNNGPVSYKPPTLHGWESAGYPDGTDASIVNNQNAGIFAPGAAGSFTAPWMQGYALYGLGRAKELGFASGPLLDWTAVWLNGAAAFDNGRLLALYQMPVEANFKTHPPGGFLSPWSAVEAALAPAYTAPGGGLDQDFANRTLADSYLGWLQAPTSYVAVEPGGSPTWSWYDSHVRQPIAVSAQPQNQEPKWALLPRTDTNVLPPQPTT